VSRIRATGPMAVPATGEGEVGHRVELEQEGQVTWKKFREDSSVAHSTTSAERLSKM